MTEDELTKEKIDAFFNEIVYGAMVGDIKKGIKAKANYLTALGLCSYTEHLGGLITGNLEKENFSKVNFKSFLKEMGNDYSKDEYLMETIYKQVRCGLVHQYFIKPIKPDGKYGLVAIRGNSLQDGLPDNIPGFWISGNKKIIFFVENYLRDFEKAVENYHKRLVDNEEEYLIENFLKATKNVLNF